MQKRISQREIARLANVRQETVSAVLNPNSRGNTRVSAESRERILRIAAEHNYRPNLQARILRGDSGSNLVGVLINAQISQFFYDLLLPLEVELRKRHRRMIIGQLGNDAAEAESVLQNFIDYNLDGVIVLHHDISDGRRLFNHYLPLLPETVFLEVPPGVSGAAAVSIDFANGVREAVAHLAAGGRRRIALCMNDLRFLSMQMRLEGYRRGIEEAGRPFDESLIFIREPRPDYTFAELISDAVDLLAVRGKADAVIAGNDEWALALLREMNRRGLPVPGKVALVGYGNILNICRSTTPELTSIHHGMEELAAKLAAALEKPGTRFPPVLSHLVVRQSSI